jgi:hypothetical protein
MRTAILIASLLGIAWSSPLFGQSNPQYTLKEDAPRTGSNIRRDLTGSIDIAVNRPYNELSGDDKARFRSNYEQMPEGDEPPFPKAGLQAILKPVSMGQQRLRVRGDLSLVGVVDPSGKVLEVKAYGSPSPEMTQFAGQVLMLTEFKPAVCSGQPCTMEFPLRMRFTIR